MCRSYVTLQRKQENHTRKNTKYRIKNNDAMTTVDKYDNQNLKSVLPVDVLSEITWNIKNVTFLLKNNLSFFLSENVLKVNRI